MTSFRSPDRLRRALLVTAFSAVAVAQTPDPPKPLDKEVAEKVAVLEEVGKDKKFARDDEGVEIIDVLYQKHAGGLNPKDDEMIVKALDGLFNRAKTRPADQTKIYWAAANALSQYGAEGAKVLRGAFEKKKPFPDRPEWVPMRERLLQAIGKTKDEAMIKLLIDVAQRSPESALQAAAGEALGNFEESKETVRKEIVREILTKWGSLAEVASQLGTNIEAQNANDRLSAVQGKWTATLTKLTGQNFDKFREWQAWYNDNKGKTW